MERNAERLRRNVLILTSFFVCRVSVLFTFFPFSSHLMNRKRRGCLFFCSSLLIFHLSNHPLCKHERGRNSFVCSPFKLVARLLFFPSHHATRVVDGEIIFRLTIPRESRKHLAEQEASAVLSQAMITERVCLFNRERYDKGGVKNPQVVIRQARHVIDYRCPDLHNSFVSDGNFSLLCLTHDLFLFRFVSAPAHDEHEKHFRPFRNKVIPLAFCVSTN